MPEPFRGEFPLRWGAIIQISTFTCMLFLCLCTTAQSKPIRHGHIGAQSRPIQPHQLGRRVQGDAVQLRDARRWAPLPGRAYPHASVRCRRLQRVFPAAVASVPVAVLPQRRLRRHVADPAARRRRSTLSQQLAAHIFVRQFSTAK